MRVSLGVFNFAFVLVLALLVLPTVIDAQQHGNRYQRVVYKVPYDLTPDVKYSPKMEIYNFANDRCGTLDGLNFIDYTIEIPKDGEYEVYSFKSTDGEDDYYTNTVMKYYGTNILTGEPITDDDGGEFYFSKISFAGKKGEKHYFRVLPIGQKQNNRDFGICYECTEITEAKKFIIGMYTLDFDNVSYCSDSSNPDFSLYNNLSIGNDYKYLDSLAYYNFNCILDCYQLQKPDVQWITDPIKPDRSYLDRALESKLDVILTAPGIDLGKGYDYDNAVQTVNYFDGHPAVISYHIQDEPEFELGVNTTEFDLIESVKDVIIANSNKDRYVCLLPLWAGESQLHGNGPSGTLYDSEDFYEEWLNPYIEKCEPTHLISDYYIWPDGVSTNISQIIVRYFYHHQTFAKASKINNIDYIPVSSPWYDYRSLFTTKNEKQYDYSNNIGLFHGAKGLMYWAREISSGLTSLGKNSWDMRTDYSVKKHVADYHEKILNNQDIILDITYQNSYHQSVESTIVIGKTDIILDECDWLDFQNDITAQKYFDVDNTFTYSNGSPTDQLAISFFKDSESNDYFWLLNKNYFDNGIDFLLNFNGEVELTDVFADQEFTNITSKLIHLESCDAKLYKISKNYGWDSIIPIEVDHPDYDIKQVYTCPADYDGDGKADMSMKCHNILKGWYLINYSSTGFDTDWDIKGEWYGGDTAHPTPGDYDGDGKDDMSVKADWGSWYIDFSDIETYGDDGIDVTYEGFGDEFCFPTQADYDGDGITDLSVKCDNINLGEWYIDYSTNGFGDRWDFLGEWYGNQGAIQAPADYDGDGKDDIGIKASWGSWYIDYSDIETYGDDGIDEIYEDIYGDITYEPIPGDYDGDGKSDLVVANKCTNFNAIDNNYAYSCILKIDYSANGFGLIDKELLYSLGNRQAADFDIFLTADDYDGDDVIDFSVFFDNNWYIDFTVNNYAKKGKGVMPTVQNVVQDCNLKQNYPNPFNPVTVIEYTIPIDADVQIVIYNAKGEVISNLVKGHKMAGIHQVSFNGVNHNSGLYFYSLSVNNKIQSIKKMLLVK
ncbi:MAG: T9SS type A sorting domain-containing protein [Candidatus Delongbacteria bacterium]|jgi:hypothetical protein|nr:T9SS type A sorting domain-containing protein [Candidatus Delongbacteria bacterium]